MYPPGYELTYYMTASDSGPSGVTQTSNGDLLYTFPAATFENVKHYWQISGIAKSSGAADTIYFRLHDTGSPGTGIVEFTLDLHATAGKTVPFTFVYPLTPSAGSHTYTIRWRGGSANNFTLSNSLAPFVGLIRKA